jgi:dihydroneopterin aldolase
MKMKLQSSYIYLRDVRFHAFHGVMPQERAVGADFVVDLRIGYDVSRAMQSDEVEDTLNYAEVYAVVKREMAQPSQLLEHVAGRIAGALADAFPAILSVDLAVTKLNPPMGADSKGAGVEIHLINDKTI